MLPFTTMERFQARLKAFGMNVTWYPFNGGHGIPDEVIRAMSEWVTTTTAGLQSRAGRD